jgi:acetyltransferase
MNNLSALFNPSSVAVFGASDDAHSVGGLVFGNLINGAYTGRIYAINPRHKTILGHPCYDSIRDVDAQVDLAVICSPYGSSEKILKQCADKGVQVAIIQSRGPGDPKKHQRWAEKLLKLARKLDIRLLGGNSMGIMRPQLGLNLLYNRNRIRDGQIALVSQSAGLCDALLDWSEAHNIGYSTVMTLGDGIDVDIGETLYYLAREKHTRVMLVYLEQIKDADALLNGMRLAASLKPVLVFSGGTPVDPCMEAALTRCGAVLLHTIDQLFPIVRLLLADHVPPSEGILLISNAVGPDYLADRQLRQYGIDVMPIPEAHKKPLSRLKPPPVALEQALILPATADARQFVTVSELLGQKGQQPLLLIITPRPEVPFDELLDTLIKIDAQEFVIICLMGETRVRELRKALRAKGLNIFDTPADAVDAYSGLAAYRRQRDLVRELPPAYDRALSEQLQQAREILNNWLRQNREEPLRGEANHFLTLLELPAPHYHEVTSLKQALNTADAIGYPVRIKPQAPISIKRNASSWINNARELRYQYLALIAEQQRSKVWKKGLGALLSKINTAEERVLHLHFRIEDHPTWKRIITLGTRSGTASCELIPLSPLLIRKLLHRAQLEWNSDLAETLLRISAIACEFSQINCIRVKLVVLDNKQVLVEDALFRLQPEFSTGRYQHLLLHPYPPDLEYQEQLPDGRTFFSRPLVPGDADEADQFLKHVSRDSLYQRFLHSVPELSDNMVRQLTLLDFHHELALIAGIDPEHEPVGIARFARMGENCDFSILIRDDMQGKGFGRRLLAQLINAARLYGFNAIQGDVLPENASMLGLASSLGFSARLDNETGLFHIHLPLGTDTTPAD